MKCKNDVKTINYRAGRKEISRLIPKQSANRNLELWEEGGHQYGFVFSSACVLSCVPWTVACHTPLSMELSRKEHWSRLPFPTPGNLPNPGIKLMSPVLVGRFFITAHLESPRNSLDGIFYSFCSTKLTNEILCFQILSGKCKKEEFISLKLMVMNRT